MKPKNIKQLQTQSRQLSVKYVDKNTFAVGSDSNLLMQYIVTVRFGVDGTVYTRCTCDWARHHGVGCVHVMATLEQLAARKGRTLSFWLTEDDAKRQKQRVFYLAANGTRNEGVWITSRGA